MGVGTKRTRQVLVTANTLLEIFKNYCGPVDVPGDAKLVQMLIKPTERGRFKFVVESPEIREGQPPLEIRFMLKRVYGLGGLENGG